MIPARGGSKGVPRKNLRNLLGLPLIAHTIKIAIQATEQDRVIVITDDDEIEEVSRFFGAQVIRESQSATGAATLDEVMLRHIPDLEALGAKGDDLLLTMQPTCPLFSPERVFEAVKKFEEGAGSVISVKDDRHLTWTIEDSQPKPLYKERVNRQLLPAQFRESGAIIGARFSDIKKHGTRIVQPIALIELPESESLDIDTFADLVVAEHWLTRKRILLHADAGKYLGMGHVYRTLALAQELARHDILIITTESMELGGGFFSKQVFSHESVSDQGQLIQKAKDFGADLVVLDVLDTTRDLVIALQATGAKVVTFEDMGEGALVADLTISDLYPNPEAIKQLSGVEHSILAPSFEVLNRTAEISAEVDHVLVLFGGTDPAELADKSLKALEAIGFQGKVSCVRGLGAQDLAADYKLDLEILRDVKNMGELMANSDLALSSAGRTISELMSIGVPTICLCQNQKELSHTHASIQNGVLNLGLGSSVKDQQLQEKLSELISDFEERKHLHQKMLSATNNRSNAVVVKKIIESLGL